MSHAEPGLPSHLRGPEPSLSQVNHSMQTTLDPTSETVSRAKAQLEGSTKRLLHLLSFVPDDKLAWTPSASAKSSLQLIVHCARSDAFFAQVITGTVPEPIATVERFFADLHIADPSIATRDHAAALLEASTSELLAALDTLTAENLETPHPSPVGAYPPSFWLGIVAEHRTTHTGQLEYLQTIWGDLDNHMG